MAEDKKPWKRSKENGWAPDPEDVAALFRVAQAKIAAGEATGLFVSLCNADGLVYMSDELPRTIRSVADAILCLEHEAGELRADWERHVIVPIERPNPLQVTGGTGPAILGENNSENREE